MANKGDIHQFLSRLPTDDPAWINTKSCDVFVTRILSHKYDFAFGVRKVLTCTGTVGDQVLTLPIHPTTCDMCDHVESRFSLDDATDFLCILMAEVRCMGCDNVFSGYSPHPQMCGTCYITCDKKATCGQRCLVCFSTDEELLSQDPTPTQTAVECPTCKQIVCYPCACNMVPESDTNIRCPQCRNIYDWLTHTVIIKQSAVSV